MQNDAHNFLSFRAFVRVQRSVEILDERTGMRVYHISSNRSPRLLLEQQCQTPPASIRGPACRPIRDPASIEPPGSPMNLYLKLLYFTLLYFTERVE